MSNFNVRDLANSLVGNGQFHLPPNDVVRQGVVIGYDPNWNGTNHDHPTLSIALGGDSTPLHGFRFADNYIPNLGDTVWVMLSGEDGWVISKLSGTANGNGTNRSPTASGVIGHGEFTDTSVITSGTATNLAGTAITTGLLPNRVYKVECSFSFNITKAEPPPYSPYFGATWVSGSYTLTITGGSTAGLYAGMGIAGDGIQSGTTISLVGSTTIIITKQTTKAQSSNTSIVVTSSHTLSSGIMTPSGYYEMNSRTVTNGVYTASGHTTWTNSITSGTYPYNWTGTHPNAKFAWYFAAKVSAAGVTAPTATGVFQRIVIHDLGVAS